MPLLNHMVYERRQTPPNVVSFSLYTIVDGWTDTYVPGRQLSQVHKDAIKWTADQRNTRWFHDSLLPPRDQLAWIVMMNVAFVFMAIAAHNARTVGGFRFLGFVTALLAIGMFLFWRHMYYNTAVRSLNKRHPVRFDDQQFSLLRQQFANRGDRDFSKWLRDNLEESAPYFRRLQPLIDEYLEVSRPALELQQAATKRHSVGSGWSELRGKAELAARAAAAKIEPLYREFTDKKQQKEREETAKRVAAATFRNQEDARISKQKITMANEDIDAYALGIQEGDAR